MAVAMTDTDVWAERRRRVRELRARHGFARQLLDFYGALLAAQQRAFEEAAAASPPPEALASYTAELVLPSVVDVSVAAGPDRLRAEVIRRMQSGDGHEIVDRWIEGADQPLVDRFLARASLGPVLEALGPDARRECAGPRDTRHCSDCGGPPQVSFFERSPDDLATGPRQLLCARCGKTWGYARTTCAGCGEDSSARLNVFSERGTASGDRGSLIRGLAGPTIARSDAVFPHMRIEACDTCRKYLLTVDVASEPGAVPVVDEMSAIPLDLFARERGYTKITTNLMGF
jgi:formate dehydrogenase maturation protein FdhE